MIELSKQKPKANSDSNALKVRYEELTSCIWDGLNMYFKASSISLAIVGVGLGYLFKVPLSVMQGRIMSLVILLMIILWYVCSSWGLKLYSTLLRNIRITAEALGITFDPNQYIVCKVIVIAAMVLYFPIFVIFVYFIFSPPIVQSTVP